MLLAFDIGNTHIVAGLLDQEGNTLLSFRIASNEKLTEDELFSYLRNITKFNEIDLKDVNGIIVSSVVPGLITICQFLGRKYFDIDPMIVSLNLKLPFGFSDDLNVTGFGADRIIGITEALRLYPNKNLVIFDLGTATTYEVLKGNTYIGGGILPGIEMTINSLFGNTAKLPKVKFGKPYSVLGTDTVEQIRAGVFYGYAGQIKYLIKKIKEEIKDPYIIATGGLGSVLSNEIDEIDEYSPELSIKGLYTLYHLNK
jgi:type III pantothenate kinase